MAGREITFTQTPTEVKLSYLNLNSPPLMEMGLEIGGVGVGGT